VAGAIIEAHRDGFLLLWCGLTIDPHAISPDRPHRSKYRKIYGTDPGLKLHLLAIIFATQASMKNQEVMMTQFQRFLATLSRVASRRVLQDGFANKLADYQVVVLTGVNLPQMVLQ
jgi:hypothetical protein